MKCLTVVDDFTRESPDILVGRSITGDSEAAFFDQLEDTRALPDTIVCDNGPEFTGTVLDRWANRRQVKLSFIQPGKRTRMLLLNDSTPPTAGEEVLSSYLFEDLDQVWEITHDWLKTYNERRSHDALGGLPPTVFREQKTAKISTYELST